MVGVAQLVEHWVVAPAVAGSNPVTHPKMKSRGFGAFPKSFFDVLFKEKQGVILITLALITVLIIVIIALAIICTQKQAKILSLKNEINFLQTNLRLFTEKELKKKPEEDKDIS